MFIRGTFIAIILVIFFGGVSFSLYGLAFLDGFVSLHSNSDSPSKDRLNKCGSIMVGSEQYIISKLSPSNKCLRCILCSLVTFRKQY